jgi:hypothetical protein
MSRRFRVRRFAQGSRRGFSSSPHAGIRPRRLRFELLEDRRVLSGVAPQVELFSVSPALFVENQGQWADESVRFLHNGNGANVAMTDSGPVFQVVRRELIDDSAEHDHGGLKSDEDLPSDGWPGGFRGSGLDRFDPDRYRTETLVFSASFVGAVQTQPVGLQPSETRFNYFVGDEANWRSDVPAYEIVAYEGLYDGIDLHTWGLRSSLKYEFHVAPGADWSQIAVRYDGIERLSLADDGSLQIDLGGDWGILTDAAPYIYQTIDGREVEVAGRFVLLDEWTYTFEITGQYDVGSPLVIDPDLAWATYLGGSSNDWGYGIAVNVAGNALVTGRTFSTNFSGAYNASNGGLDAFVAKVSSSGSLQWATYLGGSRDDWGVSIAVDTSGNALVTGRTASTNFSGANNVSNGGVDVFVAKVSSSGSLQWATYLGGSGSDSGRDIAVDPAGNALVTGSTYSTDFSGANNASSGGQDVFMAKVSSSGSLQWATYLGGSRDDWGASIAVDPAGNALVTGSTHSSDFSGANNASNGGQDVFMAKVSPSGSLQWATYLGGGGNEWGNSIAVDPAGNALVTGSTNSTDFSGANNAHNRDFDVFVAKVSPSGSLEWATYLGGGDEDASGGIRVGVNDAGRGITVDTAGNALVTGSSNSTDFSGAKNASNGGYDAFVALVSSSGSLQWATYLGGSGYDSGHGIALDAVGNALVTGETNSTNFSGANNASNGSNDAFVAKISFTNPGDTLTTALGLGTLLGGSPLTRQAEIGDGLHGARDVDMYKFTLARSGRLEVDLTTFEGVWPAPTWPLAGCVRLFDQWGREIASETTYFRYDAQGYIVGVGIDFVSDLLPAGVYYVGVSGAPNRHYDPTSLGGRMDGSTGSYRVSVGLQGLPAGSWTPQIAVAATYDGKPDPKVLGQFLVGAGVDPLWNTFSAHVTAPQGMAISVVAFDTNFNGVLDAGDYIDADGSNGWTWTTNVSALPGDVTLRVWAQEAGGAWSAPAEFAIQTLAMPTWMNPELTRVRFDTSRQQYEIQSLIGTRFGADTPESFPEWMAYRNGERTWNGIYAGASVEAYVKLSGQVVTREVVPVVGMSFLGIDLPLKLNFGRQSSQTIDLLQFIDLCRDLDNYVGQNMADSYPGRKFSPQVEFSYQGQLALDNRLNLTEFQFKFGMGMSASGTAFSLKFPPMHYPIPAAPVVSVVVTPSIGWSPSFDVDMSINLDASGQPRFQTFSAEVGATGTVAVAGELAVLGGMAQGGVEARGSLGLGFNATYDGDWVYSVPLSLGLGFDFVGSLLWGAMKGRFPIWSWGWSGNLWTSGAGSGEMAAMAAGLAGAGSGLEDVLLVDAATARSATGQIGYAWTRIPLDGTPSPLSFQQHEQGVWDGVEQVIGSQHHRGHPALIALNDGRWMVLWSQSNLLADELDALSSDEVMAAQEIWYAVRDASGWGPAQRLTENGVCDDSPAIVQRGDGSVLAVWRQMDGVDISDFTASNLVFSVWNGLDWSAPAVLADTVAGLSHPVLTALPDETVVATWLADTSGYGAEVTVWSAVHDGTGWSPAVRISDGQPGVRAWPRLAALADGRAVAFWTEEDGRGALLMTAVRDADSGQWADPEPATDFQRLVGKPEVLVDGSIVRVVYNGYDEHNELVVVSRDFADAESVWSEPEPISPSGEVAWWGSAALDDAGGLLARYVTGNVLADSSMLALPDLVIATADVTLETVPPVPGIENVVEALIVNRGLAASGPTSVALYDGAPDDDGTLVVEVPLPALAVGQAMVIRVPWTPADARRYSLHVVVDDPAVVAEIHEDNNQAEFATGVHLAPSVALDPASDTGLVGDGRTTVTAPRLVGTAEAGVTVAVFVDSQEVPLAFAPLSDGAYSVVLPALSLGPHTVWVQAIDNFGDRSPISDPLELFIEAAELASVAWLGLAGTSDSGLVGDGRTNIVRPEVFGWGYPNATVSVYSGETLLGQTTSDGQGGFHFTPTADLSDGLHVITAIQRDNVGNVSPASSPLPLTIDTMPPKVEHVLLRGSTWSQSFVDQLDADGLGHPRFPAWATGYPMGLNR